MYTQRDHLINYYHTPVFMQGNEEISQVLNDQPDTPNFTISYITHPLLASLSTNSVAHKTDVLHRANNHYLVNLFVFIKKAYQLGVSWLCGFLASGMTQR